LAHEPVADASNLLNIADTCSPVLARLRSFLLVSLVEYHSVLFLHVLKYEGAVFTTEMHLLHKTIFNFLSDMTVSYMTIDLFIFLNQKIFMIVSFFRQSTFTTVFMPKYRLSAEYFIIKACFPPIQSLYNLVILYHIETESI